MGDKGELFATMKWPKIKPKPNLSASYLKNLDLFTVENCLTSDEAKGFVKIAESLGFTHQGSRGPAYGEAFRDNHRISVNNPVLADTLWQSGLSNLFTDIKIRRKVAVGLNPNIRFYRYSAGQHFGRHIDESVDLEDGKRTYYTLLIYLSGNNNNNNNNNNNAKSKSKSSSSSKTNDSSSPEPLVGGETVFYGSRNSIVAEVAPVEGMALFHIHGDKCMLHEGRNVSKGVKYVFRSDVVFV